MRLVVIFALLLFLSGCSFICYGRIGAQELRNVELKLESQVADPNIPVDIGLFSL
ncbi:hypothetical protein LCGC14_2675020 [marine sediment metagenome]|uniref:Uncharacterized protein n=1 Tax=marine sediment metagenome TaxID=412755 RepID=A0A0F9CET2_9ZZZZ